MLCIHRLAASDPLIRGCTRPQKYLVGMGCSSDSTCVFRPPRNKVWCQTRVYSSPYTVWIYLPEGSQSNYSLTSQFISNRISLSLSTPRAEVVSGSPFQWPIQFNPLFASYNQTMGKTLVCLKSVQSKICLQISCSPFWGNVRTSPVFKQQPGPTCQAQTCHACPLPSPAVWSFQP